MKILFKALALGLLVASSTLVSAQTAGYEEIDISLRTENPDKIEVVEFFWYGCPHCFQFESFVKEWKSSQPEKVAFINAAPPLNPAWKIHSQAFYAAGVLDVLEQFHEPFFNAIHVDKKQMRKPKDIGKFVDSIGLDGEEFQQTMKSFNVDAMVRQAMQMSTNAGINAVPSVIVNGKYRTSGSIAGSYENLIEVLDELVAKESSQ